MFDAGALRRWLESRPADAGSESRRQGRPRTRVGAALALVAVNLAVASASLGALELLLALRDSLSALPRNGWVDGQRYTWGHVVRTNRLGFRERDFVVPKPAGSFRVMVLGDSLTWGAGLSEAQRYTNRLEPRLQREMPARRVEVLNFALIGGPTTRALQVLTAHVDRVDPDLIVVGFCLNDPQPLSQDHSPERARLARSLARVQDRLARIGLARTATALGDVAGRLAVKLGAVPSWPEALDRAYRPDSPEWRAFEAALAGIKAVSDRRGLPPPIFAVLNQGSSSEGPTDYAHPDPLLRVFLRWYDQAERAARTKGFVAYDHREEIARRLPRENLAVNRVDGHPSARLNEVYADKLLAVILSRRAGEPARAEPTR